MRERHLAVLGRLAGAAAELRLERLEHLLRADSAHETFVQTSTMCRPTGSRWNMS